MVKFHGDLLMGEAALRNVEGMIAFEKWSGRFSLAKERLKLLELRRPYLLLLDDGRTSHVVVTGLQKHTQPENLMVEFTACY